MTLLRRLVHDARGGVALLAAASMTIAMAMAALAVDLGAVFHESRRLQGIADAAAMAAAGNLAAPTAAVKEAIDASGWDRIITPTIVTGRWSADASVAVPARFVSSSGTPNAARVSVAEDAPLYFGRVFGIASIHLGREATAARIDLASFSLGSRMATLDGGLANQLFGKLTGSTLTLIVADYDALLGADVDLLGFVAALRTQAAIGGGSFASVLAAQVTMPAALAAVANALDAAGKAAAALAVRKIAAGSGAMPAASMGRLIDLGPLGAQDRANPGQAIGVSAYDLVHAMLELATPNRQVQLDLGAAVPGLARTTVTLAIGERMASSPWLAVTASGDPIVRTAQTRLYLEGNVGPSSALALLGVTAVRLPLYVELAEAQARLSSLTCGASQRGVTLQVLPSIGHAAIADVATGDLRTMTSVPPESDATFVGIGGIRVTGAARIDLSGNGWQTVPFTTAEVDAHATRTVTASGAVGALATSLLAKASLGATVAGTGPLGPITVQSPATAMLVKPLLDAAAPALDGLLARLTDLLGIHLGQADVRIDGVRCGSAALVA